MRETDRFENACDNPERSRTLRKVMLDQECPHALQLSDTLNHDALMILRSRFRHARLDYYYCSPEIGNGKAGAVTGKVLPNQTRYRSDPTAYFRTLDSALEVKQIADLCAATDPVIAQIFDRFERLMGLPIETAKHGGRDLLPYAYRHIISAQRHLDRIPATQPWDFTKEPNWQVSWTITINSPSCGGETRIWFPHQQEPISFQPSEGSILMFRSDVLPHDVLLSPGPEASMAEKRVTLAGFLAHLRGDSHITAFA